MINKVEICGVNTAKLPMLSNEEKNELLIRGIIPKSLEPQCLLGCTISKENINEELINSIGNVYDKYLKEKAIKVIKNYNNINICEEFI